MLSVVLAEMLYIETIIIIYIVCSYLVILAKHMAIINIHTDKSMFVRWNAQHDDALIGRRHN